MRLVARSARLGEKVLEMGPREVILGRDPASDLVLEAADAAPIQARLFAVGADVLVENLGAESAVSLDGRPLPPGEPVVVPPSSRLQIGDLTVARDGSELSVETTPAVARTHTSPSVRRGVLGEIVESILRLADRQAFLEMILEAVFRTVNVRRAFVLIAGPDTETPHRAASRNLEAEDPTAPVEISQTILERTLRGGRSQLLTNAMCAEDLKDAASVFDLSIKSVLCVPIRLQGRPAGLVYADNRLREASFTEEDLEYLETLGRLTGVMLEYLDQRDRQERRIRELEAKLRDGVEFLCVSSAMERVLDQVRRYATVEGTVLITGESGTGKELVARTLHNLSMRRDRPFVAVNCAAVPETLLETELFGHERGAFTGADRDHKGKFEIAHGGTLFLDEVSEMSPAMQAKLLRVLEGHPFERLGGDESIRVDVRVVAATNRDVDVAAREGTFRRDLLYRIRVLGLTLPPLRERPEAILPLARYFLLRVADRPLRFSREVCDAFERYSWPGNVRELRNVIERAAVMSSSASIEIDHLPVEVAGAPETESRIPPLSEVIRDHVLAVMARTAGNVARTARLLGVSRNTVYRHVRELGPEPTPPLQD